MYLLLGDLNDLACSGVFALLERRGFQARRIGDPTLAPFMFAWRFDNLDSSSQLVCEDGTQLSDREIDGVLVTKPEKLTATDWNPNDLAYAQAETDAALLAWLWSLDCPVINRYPAALWFYSVSAAPLLVPDACAARVAWAYLADHQRRIRGEGLRAAPR